MPAHGAFVIKNVTFPTRNYVLFSPHAETTLSTATGSVCLPYFVG